MDKELRVLIVEDSAVDAELITREFNKEGLVHTSKLVKSKDEFLKALGEFTPDIILCDYKMPGFGAPEALEIIKQSSAKTPFVVVSGAIGEDVAVEMMRSGAVDYVMKNKIFKLAPAVKRALKEKEERAERKELEEEARKYLEELKAAYSKLKEVQAQVVQSAKLASMGQLAGGMAHEINNPLTGVINNVQLIKMEAANKESFNLKEFKGLLDVVEESAARCKRITQSILDFSHASNGIFGPLSLNEIVEKVTILIAYELKLQNILIQKDLQLDLPLISGDSQLLQQVIFNFISNAKWAIQKKSAKEGGTITIKTQYEAEKKGVCISISDSGVGVSRENLKNIFESFFSTKEVGEGTGLGLTLAQDIVHKHGGHIEVESQLGEGATFKVSFPSAI